MIDLIIYKSMNFLKYLTYLYDWLVLVFESDEHALP